MKISILAGFFISIFLISLVYGEKVLNIDLEVFKDDSVKVNKIILMEGNPTVYISPGEYKLRILDYENNVIEEIPINLVFMVMTDPPKPTDSAFINLRLPYKQEMQTLKLFNKDMEIFSTKIQLCNNDNVCDINYENFLSCPEDCPLDKKDGICIKEADKICDPDCAEGVDPDCKAVPTTIEITRIETTKITTVMTTTTTIQDKKTDFFIYLPLFIIIVLILSFVVIIYMRRKIKKKEKGFDNSKVVSWVREKLSKGENPEILKKGLEAEGYSPEIVDKILSEDENFK
ncbi:MAG: hypothetical protein QW802_00525 [Candidatus Altiarchaeota archaeon]